MAKRKWAVQVKQKGKWVLKGVEPSNSLAWNLASELQTELSSPVRVSSARTLFKKV